MKLYSSLFVLAAGFATATGTAVQETLPPSDTAFDKLPFLVQQEIENHIMPHRHHNHNHQRSVPLLSQTHRHYHESGNHDIQQQTCWSLCDAFDAVEFLGTPTTLNQFYLHWGCTCKCKDPGAVYNKIFGCRTREFLLQGQLSEQCAIECERSGGELVPWNANDNDLKTFNINIRSFKSWLGAHAFDLSNKEVFPDVSCINELIKFQCKCPNHMIYDPVTKKCDNFGIPGSEVAWLNSRLKDAFYYVQINSNSHACSEINEFTKLSKCVIEMLLGWGAKIDVRISYVTDIISNTFTPIKNSFSAVMKNQISNYTDALMATSLMKTIQRRIQENGPMALTDTIITISIISALHSVDSGELWVLSDSNQMDNLCNSITDIYIMLTGIIGAKCHTFNDISLAWNCVYNQIKIFFPRLEHTINNSDSALEITSVKTKGIIQRNKSDINEFVRALLSPLTSRKLSSFSLTQKKNKVIDKKNDCDCIVLIKQKKYKNKLLYYALININKGST